jgi:hypothetical protein
MGLILCVILYDLLCDILYDLPEPHGASGAFVRIHSKA